jgi:hypothetical protein
MVGGVLGHQPRMPTWLLDSLLAWGMIGRTTH